jgi:hypothetical protein
LYADTRPHLSAVVETTVHSPQHIELVVNPTFIWVRAANRRHINSYFNPAGYTFIILFSRNTWQFN